MSTYYISSTGNRPIKRPCPIFRDSRVQVLFDLQYIFSIEYKVPIPYADVDIY